MLDTPNNRPTDASQERWFVLNNMKQRLFDEDRALFMRERSLRDLVEGMRRAACEANDCCGYTIDNRRDYSGKCDVCFLTFATAADREVAQRSLDEAHSVMRQREVVRKRVVRVAKAEAVHLMQPLKLPGVAAAARELAVAA